MKELHLVAWQGDRLVPGLLGGVLGAVSAITNVVAANLPASVSRGVVRPVNRADAAGVHRKRIYILIVHLSDSFLLHGCVTN